jgi:hypothetical protein
MAVVKQVSFHWSGPESMDAAKCNRLYSLRGSCTTVLSRLIES